MKRKDYSSCVKQKIVFDRIVLGGGFVHLVLDWCTDVATLKHDNWLVLFGKIVSNGC